MRLEFELNGDAVSVQIEGSELLLPVLREKLGATGTKEGCGQGECGACTVLIDGDALNACMMPAAEVAGRRVTTIEGLMADAQTLGPVQQAFAEKGGIQCGFCSPGMILSAQALLDHVEDPTDDEVRHSLRGNLCRCTGYVQIVESIRRAQALRKAAECRDAAETEVAP
jgi:aerobic-type carbon monoxide dehydrogenase small subunit (CoxS/CutS family)